MLLYFCHVDWIVGNSFGSGAGVVGCMDYGAVVDAGYFELSGNCVVNFVWFDVGADDGDVTVAVDVVVCVAYVVDGEGVVGPESCSGAFVYC